MSESPKIDAGKVLDVPLALGAPLIRQASISFEKLAVGAKISAVKEHKAVEKIVHFSDYLWTLLGLALIFHGAQFKNLFLCSQIFTAFCYTRMQGSIVALYNDLTTAKEKMDADEGDSKPEGEATEAKSKHAEKRASKKDGDKAGANREEDAAQAKKLLKVMDTDKISAAVFEVCVAAMGCHMVMEGGLVKVVVVTNALVKASKEKVNGLLKFSGYEDMQAWTDLVLSMVFYSFFGSMAVVAPSMAFALNLAVCGAQLFTSSALKIVEGMGKIPKGVTAQEFATSVPGLAMLGGLTLFGAMWQFWAIMAESDMAFYFKVIYLPAYMAEGIVSLF